MATGFQRRQSTMRSPEAFGPNHDRLHKAVDLWVTLLARPGNLNPLPQKVFTPSANITEQKAKHSGEGKRGPHASHGPKRPARPSRDPPLASPHQEQIWPRSLV